MKISTPSNPVVTRYFLFGFFILIICVGILAAYFITNSRRQRKRPHDMTDRAGLTSEYSSSNYDRDF